MMVVLLYIIKDKTHMTKQRKVKEHNPDSPFLFFDEPGSEYSGKFSHWQEKKG
jgi:hypothetical protein